MQCRRWKSSSSRSESTRSTPSIQSRSSFTANSRQYEHRPTGWASYRAQLWRTLDPSRTGIIYDEAAHVERYLSFALDAIAMRGGDGSGFRPFREWITEAAVKRED